MFTAVIATLAVNIAANVVSPANDFANTFPRHIDFKRGGLITGVLGIAAMPWELLKNAGRYINWLVGYSGSLGAIAGVLIVDSCRAGSHLHRSGAAPVSHLRAEAPLSGQRTIDPDRATIRQML